jgi:type I restriction enzyme S subunit
VFDGAPYEWITRTLGDAVEAILTGPFGSSLHECDYVDGGTPVVNPTNISNGRIVPDPAKTITGEKVDELSSFILREGDVVLGRRGDIGRCAGVSKDQEGWLCGTGCFIIRPGTKSDPYFLTCALGSPAYRKKLESLASGMTMLNLGNKALNGMEILLPPVAEQRRIAEVLLSVDRAIARGDAAVRAAEYRLAILAVFANFDKLADPAPLEPSRRSRVAI